MQDIDNWLDIMKQQRGFRSDYQLARYWNVPTAVISQYRAGRLRLPCARCLEIAQSGYYHPLEVMLSLEYGRAREEDREIIKQVYWQATLANAGDRMSARVFSTKFYGRRKF